jgi:streptomycin 6-kinase
MDGFSIQIPMTLVENRRDSAPEWLAALPDTIRRCTGRWDLTVEPPFPSLSFNYAAPAVRGDGEKAVLKLCPPDAEFFTEVDALHVFGGRGMVRLLEAEETWGAMLLERLEPGKAIIDLANDAEATGIALDVMEQFWSPPPPKHRFPALADWFERAFDRHRAYYGGSGPFHPGLFARSERLCAELLATSGEPAVLHGDLNYGNVLSAAREPWVGIDPKGIIGEPVFDTAILLHDPPRRILAQPSPRAFLRRRVDQIVDRTSFPRDRVAGWGIAYAVLSALWSAEDGGSGWEGALACAEVLETL